MVGGGPGSNSRGRGGKFKKFTRGGGKHFSRNLRPLDADGNEISMWGEEAKGKNKDSDSDEDDEEEDISEEEDEDENAGKGSSVQLAATTTMSREERKKQKSSVKEKAREMAQSREVKVGDMPSSDSEAEYGEGDSGLANPNHSRAARNQAQAPVSRGVDEAAENFKAVKVGTPSRRERESMEAAQAKARYQKLHEAGKTDEAKADLARLRLIREKRDAEAAQRSAEKEEREAQEKARRAEIEAKEAKKRAAALGTKGKKGKN